MVELRRYMGPKYAQIPRGATVRLIKKIGKKGIVEHEGERYVCPLRILWGIKGPDPLPALKGEASSLQRR